MEEQFYVSLAAIAEEMSMELLYAPKPIEEILIHSTRVNRPGLQLFGFFDLFEPERIQLIGRAEDSYLSQLSQAEKEACIDRYFSHHPIALIVTSEIQVPEWMLQIAKKYELSILTTKERTSAFMAALIAYLNVMLAPRITRHGGLVEVYGEGILLLGDSGIGKSETTIELVKRGHRLIADDAVEIKRVSKKSLVGSAPEIIRHYIELRGVGVVDVRRLFGMGAVKVTEKIDLIIQLEHWEQGKMYDRLGLDEERTDILGIEIPTITIPVCPGRNLSIVIETAAMNNRLKRMGYNTAEEFNRRIMESMQN